MAYDEDVANRIRELIAHEPDVAEKTMFGGLAFLISGHMAVAVSGQDGLLVRVDPSTSGKLVETTTAEYMVMRGREMQGWLLVPVDGIRTKRQLARWVRLGITFASSLPPK